MSKLEYPLNFLREIQNKKERNIDCVKRIPRSVFRNVSGDNNGGGRFQRLQSDWLADILKETRHGSSLEKIGLNCDFSLSEDDPYVDTRQRLYADRHHRLVV